MYRESSNPSDRSPRPDRLLESRASFPQTPLEALEAAVIVRSYVTRFSRTVPPSAALPFRPARAPSIPSDRPELAPPRVHARQSLPPASRAQRTLSGVSPPVTFSPSKMSRYAEGSWPCLRVRGRARKGRSEGGQRARSASRAGSAYVWQASEKVGSAQACAPRAPARRATGSRRALPARADALDDASRQLTEVDGQARRTLDGGRTSRRTT